MLCLLSKSYNESNTKPSSTFDIIQRSNYKLPCRPSQPILLGTNWLWSWCIDIGLNFVTLYRISYCCLSSYLNITSSGGGAMRMTWTECCRKVAARAPQSLAVACNLIQSCTVSFSGIGTCGPNSIPSSGSFHGVTTETVLGTVSGMFDRNSRTVPTADSLISDTWLLVWLAKNADTVSCQYRFPY